ncbi:hypothetical protein XACW160_290032 [Xanthomonas citri pv. citri]|nr:hypothetical protein XACW160_290032 [Xanthomonas citri pv. citri]CEH38761.1 hypothetical protein XACJK48_2700005 [Xanthomonas citri pv. citri]CEH57459.1 hypothetical protein XAC3610_3610005 [Xanthomonas citri pv. citri]CEH91211.1 hypothetical protein XACLH37_610021 [Xanthomonas citri pv. citri]CEH92162.1 hypothetical protein XAC3612_680020 [Xanthomonas citri pv. citri]
MHIADRAFQKTGLAIGQVKLPHADEALVVTQRTHLRQLRHETLPPRTQGQRIARADVFQVEQAQIAGARDCAGHRRDRRDEAAREDMPFDEVHRMQRLFVAVVFDGDGLDQRFAIVSQQAADLGEVRIQILVADGFDHLDRDHAVEAAFQVAVVAQQHRHPIAQTCRGDALVGQLELLAGNGGGGDAAAVFACGVQCKAAPAGADLHHMMVRRQAQFLADAFELAGRRALQCRLALRLFAVDKDGRRVHQVFIQKQFEQRVAQVVMRGDIAPAAAAGIARKRMQAAHGQAAQARGAGLHRVQPLAVAQQQPHQRHQVVALPLPIHIRLARTDAAVERRLPIKTGVDHAQLHLQGLRASGRAKRGDSTGFMQLQLSIAQLPKRGQQALAQQTVRPGGRARRSVIGQGRGVHRGSRTGG